MILFHVPALKYARTCCQPHRRLILRIAAVNCLAVLLWLLLAGRAEGGVVGVLTAEWGLLETGQAVLLAAAAVICFVSACMLREVYYATQSPEALSATPPQGNGSVRDRASYGVAAAGWHVRCVLGLFFIILLLRELEIDRFGTSPGWELLERVLRMCVAVVAIVYALYLLPQWRQLLAEGIGLLGTGLLTLLVAGVALYVLGWPFDKQVFAIGEGISLLLEELLELNACIAFFLAARTAASVRSVSFRESIA